MRFDLSVKKRFEDKFIPEPNSGCWLWFAARDSLGYGRFRIGSVKDGTRESAIAPRVAWQLYIGEIPDGLDICHTCDTPACVNPDHLFPGTALDNMRDCSKKGRTSKGERHSQIQKGHIPKGRFHSRWGKPGLVGEQNGQAKITEADVRAIRADSRQLQSIADDYGITFSNVSCIRLRKSWKHLP